MGSAAYKVLYLLGSWGSFPWDKVRDLCISPFTSLGDDKNAWMYTSIHFYGMLLGKVATLTLHAIQHFYTQFRTFVQRIQNEAKLVTKTFPFVSIH
jgi:hypothetical protein